MRDRHNPRRVLRTMRPLAKDIAELALGLACLAFLEVSGVAYIIIDEVRYRRSHPEWMPYGGHGPLRMNGG